jgi:hypothetical protein
MQINPHLNNSTLAWENSFKAAAKADKCRLFREQLEWLSLPKKPKLMLEGTIFVMQAIACYAKIDGIPLDPFLAMQQYDPAKAPDARYVFTFYLSKNVFARVLTENNNSPLDLADLYNHPWYKYKSVGYHRLWITHPDYAPLDSAEMEQLKEMVTDDLSFDYREDELSFHFEECPDGRFLLVGLHDVEPGEIEDLV